MTSNRQAELEYGRSPRELRIFICSILSDDSLRPERIAAAEALRMLRISTPWMWERDAVATPRTPDEIYIETARTSDGLILIVGGALTPATLAEYEAAVSNGVPCFVFVKEVGRDASVAGFLDSVRRQHVYKKFRTPDELKTLVLEAIRQHVVWSWRSALRSSDRIGFVTSLAPTLKEAASEVAEPFSTIEQGDARADIDYLRGTVLREFRNLSASEQAAIASGILDEATNASSEAIARFVLDELVPLVTEDDLAVIEGGWLANSKGLGILMTGDYEGAIDEFEYARSVGESESSLDLVAVALQNLSILEHQHGDSRAAEELAVQALEVLGEQGDDRRVLALKLNLASILETTGRIEAALELLDDVDQGARSQRDWSLVASVNGSRGLAHAHAGRFAEAEKFLRRSLRSGQRRDDSRTELLARYNLGTICLDSGDYRRAVRWYRSALGLVLQLGAQSMEASIHRAIAESLRRDDNLSGAKSHLKLARAAIQLTGNQREIAMISNDYGVLELQAEEPDLAEATLREALASFVLCSDREGQSLVLQNLAVARFQKGAVQEALLNLDQALVLVSNSSAQADIFEQRAQMALHSVATAGQAAESFKEMLEVRSAELAPDELAWAYGQAAHFLSDAGLTTQAIDLFDEGASIARDSADLETEFHLINDKGVALADSGEADSAVEVFEECIRSEACRSNRPLAQQAMYNLGESLRRSGDSARALRPTLDAVEMARDLDDPHAVAQSLCNLGTLYVDMDELANATAAFQESLAIAIAEGHRETEARSLSGIGNVEYLAGRFPMAREYYRRSADIHRDLDEDDDYISSLGAAAEALAVQGHSDMQEHFQHLIDEAQERQQEEVVSETFARIGRRYLDDGNIDYAVDCFAIAVVAGAVSTRDADQSEAFLKGFARGVALVSSHLLLSSRTDLGDLIRAIVAELDESYQLPASALNEAFSSSMTVMNNVLGDSG